MLLLSVCFREIRNVELLKLRFGESHMHYCEVMLKVSSSFFSTTKHFHVKGNMEFPGYVLEEMGLGCSGLC